FAHREKAARAYKDLNLLGMKLLKKGGKLFTFSCSGAMDDDLFGKVIAAAAQDANADFRIVRRMIQGPDHPVSSRFPEGHYLKGIYGIRCS
ncbi:MAG: 23S rRNA (cytosine(1962)-C(5))-methyltransferase RlmI, partial [Lentisphaeria bacterium]|nr:23S rRNA (cytosine(1962)-C(5))-methyltransferase RlmI [Lentisphaeria bacterium]